MSCSTLTGFVGVNNSLAGLLDCVFEIFLGDAKTLSLRAVNTATLIPLDLTSCTEISVALPNADGSFTALLLSLSEVSITSPAVLGQFQAPITSVVSALLNPGELQFFDVTFTISGLPQTIRYANALSVFST